MFCCVKRVGLAALVDMDQELLALQRHVVAARVDSLRQSSTAAMEASHIPGEQAIWKEFRSGVMALDQYTCANLVIVPSDEELSEWLRQWT